MKRVSAGVVLALASAGAQAHGATDGLAGFFGGLFHPVTEPAHLIAMLALGLLLGQRALREQRAALLMLAGGAVAGCIAAGLGWKLPVTGALLAAALIAGLAVAAGRGAPVPVSALLAAAASLAMGLDSAPDSGSAGERAVALAGTAVGIVWWTVDVALICLELKRPWLRVLVRVAGSWLSACALLVLALHGRSA